MVKRLYKDENDRGKSLDDRHEILNVYRSQCAQCKHFKRDDYYCPAYPDGIPDELLEGDATHDKRRTDQTGDTLFEDAD